MTGVDGAQSDAKADCFLYSFENNLPAPPVEIPCGGESCGGVVTNGTRPGQDYASVKMAAPADTALDCQCTCCDDPRCLTWVYVPSGLYPDRPAGTFCWLKSATIDLKGSTCDNGKPGCMSGVVNRTANIRGSSKVVEVA